LSWRHKEAIEQLLRISRGREFQMVGAATEKPLEPKQNIASWACMSLCIEPVVSTCACVFQFIFAAGARPSVRGAKLSQARTWLRQKPRVTVVWRILRKSVCLSSLWWWHTVKKLAQETFRASSCKFLYKKLNTLCRPLR